MWKDKQKTTAQRSHAALSVNICVWLLYAHFVSYYSKSWFFFYNNFDRPYIKSRHVNKICALLRFYATYRGFFPKFLVPSSRVKHPRYYLTFEDEADALSGNVGNYHLYAAWNPKIAQNSFAARTKTEITHSFQSFKKCQALQNRGFFYSETGKQNDKLFHKMFLYRHQCLTIYQQCVEGKAVPLQAWTGPRWFQEVKVPRFRDNGTGWW